MNEEKRMKRKGERIFLIFLYFLKLFCFLEKTVCMGTHNFVVHRFHFGRSEKRNFCNKKKNHDLAATKKKKNTKGVLSIYQDPF